MDNLPLGTGDGARGALSVTRVTTFVGLCAFMAAIQLFDNVIILENTTAFNNALYTILAQAAFLAVVGGIGMACPLRFPRAVVVAAGVVAAAGAPLSIATTSTGASTAAAIAGGLAMALLTVSWGSRLATMDPARIAVQLTLAALVTLGASCMVCALFSGATMNPYALQSNTIAWIMHA